MVCTSEVCGDVNTSAKMVVGMGEEKIKDLPIFMGAVSNHVQWATTCTGQPYALEQPYALSNIMHCATTCISNNMHWATLWWWGSSYLSIWAENIGWTSKGKVVHKNF